MGDMGTGKTHANDGVQYMRHRFVPLTRSSQARGTVFSVLRAKDWVQQVGQFQRDEQRELRVRNMFCKACFYLFSDVVGGCAMTTCFCGLCGVEWLAGSTAHEKICPECAKKHNLCRWCGGDVDMNVKRKEWPDPVEKSDDE